MAATEVIFHRLAAREYWSARDWYQERSPEIAERFRIAVDQAVRRIAANADSLPTLMGMNRYVRVQRFPYVLVFRQLAPNVNMVVAIAHTSRRLGYWRQRR